eukprot:10122340-Alexandrium_andersonii.AAC.1
MLGESRGRLRPAHAYCQRPAQPRRAEVWPGWPAAPSPPSNLDCGRDSITPTRGRAPRQPD